MKYDGLKLLAALLVLLTVSKGALPQSTEDVFTAYVEGDKSAVIAFTPPPIQDSQDKRATVEQERVRSAIENTNRCLGEDDVSYRAVVAARSVVRTLGGEETLGVGHSAPFVGALLLRPGSSARILFTGAGQQALAQMLRPAASEYHGKRCKAG